MYFELIIQALLSIGEALNQVQVRVLYVTFRMRGTRPRLAADVELFVHVIVVGYIVLFTVSRTISYMRCKCKCNREQETLKNGFFVN